MIKSDEDIRQMLNLFALNYILKKIKVNKFIISRMRWKWINICVYPQMTPAL